MQSPRFQTVITSVEAKGWGEREREGEQVDEEEKRREGLEPKGNKSRGSKREKSGARETKERRAYTRGLKKILRVRYIKSRAQREYKG